MAKHNNANLIPANIPTLQEKARISRRHILEMCTRAGEGRIASAFSCTELLVSLFQGRILRFDASKPEWDERDRFIMSKSPGAVGLYPILADLGFFPADELEKFCSADGMLGPYGDTVPGVEAVWGSLGHGLGVGAGLALAAKLDKNDYMTVVMIGDGETYEGSIWEAAMFAAHHKLDNLVAITDRNGICTIDFTENCLKLDPLEDKWKSFGWDAVTIDGHSYDEIFTAFKDFHNRKSNKPLMVIANTIKGKGVSVLENNPMGHIMIPSGNVLEQARQELNK